MDDSLRTLAALTGGHLLRRQLLAHGESDRSIRTALASGVLVRLRPGTYAFADADRTLTPEQRHLVLARSVVDRLGPDRVALSHVTACLAHGIDQFGADLRTVHVVRLDGGAGRVEAGVAHHTGALRPEEVVEREGMLVVAPARAVWEAACASSQRGALVLFDSALHRGDLTTPELAETAGRYAAWQGARAANFVRASADAGAETVGESLLRFCCIENRLPRPTTQFVVADHDGVLVARTDLAWELHRHLAEFDGLRKYWRDLRPGEDASAAVVREKNREDRARGQLFGMSRATWNDVLPSASVRTAQRISFDLQQSHRLYAHGRTVIA